MTILLDTHVLLALLRGTLETQFPEFAERLADPGSRCVVSVASLWEIAIKVRLGKLDPGMSLEVMEAFLGVVGCSILPIEARHVIVAAEPEPLTRDPFDRLLLAQCHVEGMELATIDRALIGHPLALRP